MANRVVGVLKRVKTEKGLRYCPAVVDKDGFIDPHMVVVDGRDPNAPTLTCYTTNTAWSSHLCGTFHNDSGINLIFSSGNVINATATTFSADMVGGYVANCDWNGSATVGSCDGIAHILSFTEGGGVHSITIDGGWTGATGSQSHWTIFDPNILVGYADGMLGSNITKDSFDHYLGPARWDLGGIQSATAVLGNGECQESCVYDGINVMANTNSQPHNKGSNPFACASFDRTFRPTTGGGHWTFGAPTSPRCTVGTNITSGTLNGWLIEGFSIFKQNGSATPQYFNGGTIVGNNGPPAILLNIAEAWDGINQAAAPIVPGHVEYVSGNVLDLCITNACTSLHLTEPNISNTLSGNVVEVHASTNGSTTGTIIDNVQSANSKPLIVNDNNHAQDVSGTAYQGWVQSGSSNQFGNTVVNNSISTLLTNDGMTGTAVNKLVSITSSGNAITTSAGAVSGVRGVAVAGAGLAGTVVIAISGQANVIGDTAVTTGHYATISATVNGDVSDSAACPATGQVIGRFLTSTAGAGSAALVLLGGDCASAPSGVSILKKTASYTGSSTDFSSPAAAPSQIIFTLTGTGQAYTLPSSAPPIGQCVILENSLASSPYILGVVTGGSTTLDGTAYATTATSLSLSPSQSEWVCSDGSNYYTQQGNGFPSSMATNLGGILVPYEAGQSGSGIVTANTSICTVFNLYKRQLVSNITYDFPAGVNLTTGDWGIYDLTSSNSHLLTHTGAQVTSAASGIVKAAASPVITLPPGQYQACACDSGPITVAGFAISFLNHQMPATSGSLIGTGNGSSCTGGVLPSTSTFTPASVTVAPALLLSP